MSRLKQLKQLRNITARLEALEPALPYLHGDKPAGLTIYSDSGVNKRVEFERGTPRSALSGGLHPTVPEQNARFDLWIRALEVPELRDQFEKAIDAIAGRASHLVEAARRVAHAKNPNVKDIQKLKERYNDNPLFEDELYRQQALLDLKDKRDTLCNELGINTKNPSGGEPEYPDDLVLKEAVRIASRRSSNEQTPG